MKLITKDFRGPLVRDRIVSSKVSRNFVVNVVEFLEFFGLFIVVFSKVKL